MEQGLVRNSTSDPEFFNTNATDFNYQTEANDPVDWEQFLDSLWHDDPESISVLQEIFGYFLVPDTRQQKMFLLAGPERSGKGTIGRVLTALLGANNVVAPTLTGLSRNFGLQPLIRKQLAIISDARLGTAAHYQQVVAERLLSISGEDAITIDRKHRSPWTGRLPCRFIILTNELPQISDTSGALASRFIPLELTTVFMVGKTLGSSIGSQMNCRPS